MKVIEEFLRAEGAPKRSWLLFFDTELEAEWIGLWFDSPAPPMPDWESE